ncbi:MAG: hypothetical protein QOE45_2242 [Frankiaceae bacterium]|jgi:hypothetical protein|nr:hypothetical protein [Frankiaceae bacterium]
MGIGAVGARSAARLVAAGRVGVGVAMLARPRTLPALLGVDSGTAARVSWITRMLGAREVALGAGTLLALRRGSAGRDWLLGAAFSDAVDAVAFAGAVGRGHARAVPGGALTLVAGASAAVGVRAARGAGPRAGPGRAAPS